MLVLHWQNTILTEAAASLQLQEMTFLEVHAIIIRCSLLESGGEHDDQRVSLIMASGHRIRNIPKVMWLIPAQPARFGFGTRILGHLCDRRVADWDSSQEQQVTACSISIAAEPKGRFILWASGVFITWKIQAALFIFCHEEYHFKQRWNSAIYVDFHGIKLKDWQWGAAKQCCLNVRRAAQKVWCHVVMVSCELFLMFGPSGTAPKSLLQFQQLQNHQSRHRWSVPSH